LGHFIHCKAFLGAPAGITAPARSENAGFSVFLDCDDSSADFSFRACSGFSGLEVLASHLLGRAMGSSLKTSAGETPAPQMTGRRYACITEDRRPAFFPPLGPQRVRRFSINQKVSADSRPTFERKGIVGHETHDFRTPHDCRARNDDRLSASPLPQQRLFQ
jgi:hypothetical protein